MNKIFDILGINIDSGTKEKPKDQLFDRLVEYILSIREDAREEQNWNYADKIRDDLEEIGISVNDTPHGVEWEIEGEDDGS